MCIPATHREQVTDTVQLIPNDIPLPTVTLQDHIAIAADHLVHTLKTFAISPPPGISPKDPTLQGIQIIASTLKKSYPFSRPSNLETRPPPRVPTPFIPTEPLPPSITHDSPVKNITPLLSRIQKRINFNSGTTQATQQLHLQHMNHIYNETTGKKETMQSLLHGNQKQNWSQALTSKWG